MGTTRPRMYPTPSCTVRLTSYMITWRKAYSPRWVNTLAVVAENINASRLMLDIATKVAHYRSKEDKCSQRPTAELISSRRLKDGPPLTQGGPQLGSTDRPPCSIGRSKQTRYLVVLIGLPDRKKQTNGVFRFFLPGLTSLISLTNGDKTHAGTVVTSQSNATSGTCCNF